MTQGELSQQRESLRKSLRPPGQDARDLVPDVGAEALRAVKEIISGHRPTTVLGVLMDRRRPMEIVTVAGLIGAAVTEVEWTVEVLGEEGFCETFEDNGVKMVRLTADWNEDG